MSWQTQVEAWRMEICVETFVATAVAPIFIVDNLFPDVAGCSLSWCHQDEDDYVSAGPPRSRGAVTQDSPQVTSSPRGSSDDVRKRMDDIYGEIEYSWRNGKFHLPLKFMDFHKTDVMFYFVRAAIGFSLAFVKVRSLEKELLQMMRDKKRCSDSGDEEDQQQALGVAELKDRVKRAMEAQQSCARSMSASYARLVLHCSNFENHKEDERFFECVYFFVCSVVKLGVVPEYWRSLEEELGYLFRGAQFSANIKLHAATAYPDDHTASSSTTENQDSTSSSHPGLRSLSGASNSSGSASNGNFGSLGSKKMQSLPAAISKDAADRLKAAANPSSFELPKSRVSHFAPSVPVRRIVAELQATKNRASRNMELSQALRDRIRTQRNEDRRRHLEAVMSPRHSLDLETESTSTVVSRPHNIASPRVSMKTTYTTRSPALNQLLPTTEERVRLALQGYEQELQEHRSARAKNRDDDDLHTTREQWRK